MPFSDAIFWAAGITGGRVAACGAAAFGGGVSAAALAAAAEIVRLTEPTNVKITKPFTPRFGAVANEGALLLLDGPTASRCINLGYGEAV